MPSISRTTDPVTSRQAADEITNDGTRSAMIETTRKLLQDHPGETANELEAIGSFKDGQIRKRLHDLFQLGEAVKGPVRPSRITGKNNTTWYASKQAPPGCEHFERVVNADLLPQLVAENQLLRERLMVGGGEPSVKGCYEYSDTLVRNGVARFGDLTRLEWMLRVVVGYSRRQDAYIKKLEAEIYQAAAQDRRDHHFTGLP